MGVAKREVQPRLYLAGIGSALLHLFLVWHLTGLSNQFMLSLICWGAIASLLWQRRHELQFDSNWPSRFLSVFLVGMLISQGLPSFWSESIFVRIFPGLTALSWTLYASGNRLPQYWREWILILTLMLPPGRVANLIQSQFGIQVETYIAQAAAFLLHYAGLDVTRQGTEIITNQQAIRVEYACTGMLMFILLLQLSVILLVIFPVPGWKQFGLLTLAGAIALSLSTVRVMIMTLVVQDKSAFHYWHGTQGTQIFSTLGIGFFLLAYRGFIEES